MLLRLFFGGLYLNKTVLARFRHGLLHLSCSRNSCWRRNSQAATGPGLGDAAMTDRKTLIGVTVAAIVLYFYLGDMLIQRFWPDSDYASYILIGVGIVGGYIFRTRRLDRAQAPRPSDS